MRERDPYWATAAEEFDVDRVSVPSSNSNDYSLVGTVNRLSRPAIDGGEIVVHGRRKKNITRIF